MEELTKKWSVYEVIRVLVVDHDPTTLQIVSKMLGLCGYEVVTANCAMDALRIVGEREKDLHLILTEVHLPDMGRYELLEKIMEQTSNKLPIVIMSADDNEIAKLGCLFKGAMLHLVKPLAMKSIRNLWQLSIIKRRERCFSYRAPSRVRVEPITDESKKNGLVRNEKKIKKWQRSKRKEQDDEEVSKEVEKGDGIIIDSTVLKRPKLIWTEQLHNRFLQTIQVLGVDKAHPKEILHHMNVPGLRKENISSHLQKFRLSLKRDRDAIQKKISESSNLKDESEQFSKKQWETYSPVLSHFGRQLPNNSNSNGVFVARPPLIGQETQPQRIINFPSNSIISDYNGSYCDMVSVESIANYNMDNSCFSKAISNQTCSMNSTQQRPFKEMAMRTVDLLPSHMEDQHCVYEVDGRENSYQHCVYEVDGRENLMDYLILSNTTLP